MNEQQLKEFHHSECLRINGIRKKSRQPTERQPTESQPTRNHLPERQPTESQPTRNHLPESQPTERQPTRNHLPEIQPPERQPPENHLPESQPPENHLPESQLSLLELSRRQETTDRRLCGLYSMLTSLESREELEPFIGKCYEIGCRLMNPHPPPGTGETSACC